MNSRTLPLKHRQHIGPIENRIAYLLSQMETMVPERKNDATFNTIYGELKRRIDPSISADSLRWNRIDSEDLWELGWMAASKLASEQDRAFRGLIICSSPDWKKDQKKRAERRAVSFIKRQCKHHGLDFGKAMQMWRTGNHGTRIRRSTAARGQSAN